MPEENKLTYQIFGDDAKDKIQGETIDVNVITKPTSVLNNSQTSQSRRMRRTTYQARLGKKLDNITQKVLDNNLRLSAHPTDMLRIEVNRDERSRDLISRTVKSVEVLPILLPKMVDIPLRHFIRDNTDIMIPSLYATQEQEYFEVYSPIEVDLNEDDLLIRILNDSSPDINNSYVMVLQVKEVLGTFGYNSLVYKKLVVTFYDESLPPQIINTIKEANKKRELLTW